jgi:hypothetical protein
MDIRFQTSLQEAVDRKCAKTYKGFDCLWLGIYGYAPLTESYEYDQIAGKLVIPNRNPFETDCNSAKQCAGLSVLQLFPDVRSFAFASGGDFLADSIRSNSCTLEACGRFLAYVIKLDGGFVFIRVQPMDSGDSLETLLRVGDTRRDGGRRIVLSRRWNAAASARLDRVRLSLASRATPTAG